MKTTKYFALAALTLALGACSDENEFYGDSKQITIEAGFGASSRVATNGLSSIFEADDAIGVYVWTGGTTLPDAATGYVANNVTNTYNGTKWTATPQMFWKDAETPHYFLAVYPQTDILATTTYTLDATDQEKSDLLVATNFGKDNGGIVAQSNPVPLAFGHVMAKLRVNIKFNDEFTTAPTVEHVTVGAHATATIDWQTATATATGNATGIELPALATAAQGYACSYESVMVPQSGFKSVVMVIGGETYTFTSNQAMQLKKGTITTLNLTVGLSTIQAEDISILDWTTGASIDGYLNNISEQITAINASLTNLKDVDVALQDLIDDLEGEAVNLKTQLDSNTAADAATKQALETKIAAIEALITILQTKDTELDGKIGALQAYVNNEITATEDWATATFATLEQYTAMQAEITAIQTLLKTCKADIVGEYTAAINTAIATLETSMKNWVNADFASGYYDIATIDGKLAVLSDALAEGNTELQEQIAAQQTALDNAKADLKTAYEKAIKDAIDTNNGIIDTQIAAAVKTAKDDLQSQINTITTALATLQTEILGVKTDIATISEQITAINASLTNLKDVDVALQDLIDDLEGEAVNLKTQLDSNTAADAATKQALETKIAAIEALITILQTKDTELDGKIAALQAYVNSEITATKDWATATFATLAQYQAVLNDIADINLLVEQNKTAIEDITNDLASMQTAIDNLHTSMQTWVNEQLQEPLADIATLQADLTNLSNSVATDQELATAIAEQQTALDNAMNGVSQTIREAITAAIGNGGTIDLAISQKIDAAKTELQSQISTINSAITTIQDRLDKLEKRIQSIRFLPEYSDGKVKIEPGMSAVELTFIVSPKEAAAIAKEKVTAFIYHTQSRAVDAVPLTVTDVSGNATTGMLTVSVTPPAEAYWATGITANIYIQINDGNNDIISEMIPAYYDVEPDYVTFSAVSEQTLDLEQRKSPKLDEEGETVYEDDGETPVYVPDPYPEYGDDTGYIEYSVGNSNVWTKFTPGSQPVAFGGDKGDLHLRGISPKGTLKAQIVFGNNTTPVACSGDIRTLVDWKNYEAADTRSAIFYGLFENCTVLTSAPELPATDLAEKCYWAMFWGCTSLAVAPELPATTLANSCYVNMFHGCAKLTEAPELPATILANGCYNGMFMDCTSLTSAPELPATNLAEYCYSSMFSGCTSLVTAPELPATTLVDNCYTCMFMNCTSLTSAPALPATTLKTGCYFQMFRHCTSLNSVTMLATDTDISATNCLTDWLEDVADTGTFTKAASMTSLPRDIHGIPSGWTVENYGESEN